MNHTNLASQPYLYTMIHLFFGAFYALRHSGYVKVLTFIIKMRVETPEAIEQSYQRMLLEMQLNDFCALWYYLTVWGQKPIYPLS
jgi:hypothetical protein